jgi:hypothetical protein
MPFQDKKEYESITLLPILKYLAELAKWMAMRKCTVWRIQGLPTIPQLVGQAHWRVLIILVEGYLNLLSSHVMCNSNTCQG